VVLNVNWKDYIMNKVVKELYELPNHMLGLLIVSEEEAMAVRKLREEQLVQALEKKYDADADDDDDDDDVVVNAKSINMDGIFEEDEIMLDETSDETMSSDESPHDNRNDENESGNDSNDSSSSGEVVLMNEPDEDSPSPSPSSRQSKTMGPMDTSRRRHKSPTKQSSISPKRRASTASKSKRHSNILPESKTSTSTSASTSGFTSPVARSRVAASSLSIRKFSRDHKGKSSIPNRNANANARKSSSSNKSTTNEKSARNTNMNTNTNATIKNTRRKTSGVTNGTCSAAKTRDRVSSSARRPPAAAFNHTNTNRDTNNKIKQPASSSSPRSPRRRKDAPTPERKSKSKSKNKSEEYASDDAASLLRQMVEENDHYDDDDDEAEGYESGSSQTSRRSTLGLGVRKFITGDTSIRLRDYLFDLDMPSIPSAMRNHDGDGYGDDATSYTSYASYASSPRNKFRPGSSSSVSSVRRRELAEWKRKREEAQSKKNVNVSTGTRRSTRTRTRTRTNTRSSTSTSTSTSQQSAAGDKVKKNAQTSKSIPSIRKKQISNNSIAGSTGTGNGGGGGGGAAKKRVTRSKPKPEQVDAPGSNVATRTRRSRRLESNKK